MKLKLEFWVGLFTIASGLCLVWLSVSVAGIKIFGDDSYHLDAQFNNVAGLKTGASVEIAGVEIGKVEGISLKDPDALVRMKIENRFKIYEEDIASVRTKGIIGDRYIKISRGGSEEELPVGGLMTETEGVVDIEDIISKIVHNLTDEE